MRSIASVRLAWPSRLLRHVGVFASSKSAMKQRAPELSALMTILRSTGPVISTRRSCRSAGTGATRHSLSRTSRVSGRKSGSSPASRRVWRSARAARSRPRVASKRRWSSATNASASALRISSSRPARGARSSSPATSVPPVRTLVAVVVAVAEIRAGALGQLGRAQDEDRRFLARNVTNAVSKSSGVDRGSFHFPANHRRCGLDINQIVSFDSGYKLLLCFSLRSRPSSRSRVHGR